MKRVFTCIALVAITGFVCTISSARAQTSETHLVQKGDTLWDLSESYLKDPLLWPKIWKINPGIDNPHAISPGQIVKIPALGDRPSTEAPAETSGAMLARPAPPPPETPAPEPAAVEPPPAPEPPVAEEVTPEIDRTAPPLALKVIEEKPLGFAEEASAVMRDIGARYYDLGIGIVTDNIPNNGRILHTEESWTGAGSGNRIYIEAPGAKVGQRFGIYRDLGGVKFPESRWAGEIGHLVADIGVIEVVSLEKGKQLAEVTRAFAETRQGDLLGPVQEVPVVTAHSREGAPIPVKGNVIAMHLGRELVGPDEIVYINLGEQNGIRPGDRLFLSGPKERKVKRDSGEILVLRVTPTTAAALVLPKSGHSVQVGDQVGPLL
jgi:hypothetical protein